MKNLKNFFIVGSVILITVLPILYGNIVAKKGGILDDCLLNNEDPFQVMDQQVRALGIRTGDPVSFVIPLKEGVTIENLAYIKWFTDELSKNFPEYGILSLSNVPRYKDTGKELLNTPYIDIKLIEKSDNVKYIEEWKREIQRDNGVYGLLVGRNFDYVQVILLLPYGYDEIKVFRKVTEFLENRSITPLEWYIKSDIIPADQYKIVMPAGWLISRGLMDAVLVADTFKLSCAGMALVTIAFFLSLLSFRQAITAISVIALNLFWVRGSIGLFQLIGFPFYERAYFLVVYTAMIVAGISFVARKFETYNTIRLEQPEIGAEEAWKATKPVNGVIGLTAFIAILNFITLYQIRIRGIMEVGIFASLGIVFLVILVFWYMPALHLILKGEIGIRPSSVIGQTARFWDAMIGKVVLAGFQFTRGGKWIKPATKVLFIVIIALGIGFGIIMLDYSNVFYKSFHFIEIKTKPLEYIRNTIVFRASEMLNMPGNYGFDRLPVLIKKKDDSSLAAMHDPVFINRVDDFIKQVSRIPDVREAKSIIDTVRLINQESYKRDLPLTSQQLYDSLQMVEADLGPLVKEQLWYKDGLVLSISVAADDSNKLEEIRNKVLDISNRQFQDLQVLPFSKLTVYPRADKYIREGKPLNAITSQWIVIVVLAAWIMFRNRRTMAGNKFYAWRTGFIMNLPFIFASSVTVIVMAVLRVPLDQATAMITALAINAAVDFGLYLVSDYQVAVSEGANHIQALHYSIVQKGRTIVIDIILNSLCFVPLMFSGFQPIFRLGWIMIIMLLACGFGALFLMPPLLPWCVKRKDDFETKTFF